MSKPTLLLLIVSALALLSGCSKTDNFNADILHKLGEQASGICSSRGYKVVEYRCETYDERGWCNTSDIYFSCLKERGGEPQTTGILSTR